MAPQREEACVFPGLCGMLWEGLPDTSAQWSLMTTLGQLSVIPTLFVSYFYKLS